MATFYAGFVPYAGGYSVLFPDFPGCNSDGDTLEQAVSMAADALAGHIEAMLNDGDSIAQGMGRQEALEAFRGQYAGLGIGPLPERVEFIPIPVPEFDARVKKVAVSFSGYRLDMIDRKAKALGMTRSGFLGAAAEAYPLQSK
ncbi:MAG: type II toxin-antitoxin system HicB family antitoxin [Deltaproteobacteria bacterium]|jgi:predicted RNase H-like HicB family nuclease|nr:type II toxin-antitoxin system HicB family antitoxin [Deltaproteobacteria bacterium]